MLQFRAWVPFAFEMNSMTSYLSNTMSINKVDGDFSLKGSFIIFQCPSTRISTLDTFSPYIYIYIYIQQMHGREKSDCRLSTHTVNTDFKRTTEWVWRWSWWNLSHILYLMVRFCLRQHDFETEKNIFRKHPKKKTIEINQQNKYIYIKYNGGIKLGI